MQKRTKYKVWKKISNNSYKQNDNVYLTDLETFKYLLTLPELRQILTYGYSQVVGNQSKHVTEGRLFSKQN